jgi:UDP-2,3-diacylglucosamine pyrophosphatase LpxH
MFEKPRKFAVVLSDIHIGDNAATCWYQDRVHFPYLAGVLRWIVARRESVREVIFLGDTFDFWTYEPARQPPVMSEIIAANPRLLRAGGPLAELVTALPGRVRLLPGNHDENLTRADIAKLNDSLTGNPNTGIQLVTEPGIVLTGASGARTLLEHGHRWCMFNAPDPKSKWKELPVGQFVSRAIAYQVAYLLANDPKYKGKTAAELPESGNGDMRLTRADVRAILSKFLKRGDLNMVEELLGRVSEKTRLTRNEAIRMPGGSRSSLGHASGVFAGLFADWARREGRGQNPRGSWRKPGGWNALRAMAADATGEDLAWFAVRQALLTHADLVVMGHTHTPIKGLEVAPLGVEYVNSGFECPSLPDTAKGVKEFTFALVDLEAPSASLFAAQQVGSRIVFAPSGAGKAPVVVPQRKDFPSPFDKMPFHDFSCYVRIENRSKTALSLVPDKVVPNQVGKDEILWVVPPPTEIPAGQRADIWLQDKFGTKGSDGGFTYTDGRSNLNFAFRCPTLFSPLKDIANHVSADVTQRSRGTPPSGLVINYKARAANDPWRPRGIAALGHPVQMRCVVGVPAAATNGKGGGVPAAATGARLPTGDRVMEGAEYLKHGRYLTTVGGRTVVNQQEVAKARVHRIRWEPSGLVARIDSVRVEDQGPLPGGRRLHIVITLRVISPGKSGLQPDGTFELPPWRAFSDGRVLKGLATV